MRQGIRWTSFIGYPADIPANALHYIQTLTLPSARNSDGTLENMDYERNPVYLDPKKHYRPYNPAAVLPRTALREGQRDLLAWIFDQSEVKLLQHILDHPNPPDEVINFTIDEDWKETCLDLGRRVNEICLALAEKAEFYNVNDVPPLIDADNLHCLFDTVEDAYDAAASARQALLDQLGLLFWFTTVTWNWGAGISDAMVQFVSELRLGERPKRGCLLSLHRDWKFMNIGHFMNVGHFMRNMIPFHYPWTDDEEKDPRFFMYSLTFLNEYSREVQARDDAPVPLEELPNYYNWRSKLYQIDMFLQYDMKTEGREWRRPRYTPDLIYSLILHEGWGARWLTDRLEIRACAELYNVNTEYHDRDSLVGYDQIRSGITPSFFTLAKPEEPEDRKTAGPSPEYYTPQRPRSVESYASGHSRRSQSADSYVSERSRTYEERSNFSIEYQGTVRSPEYLSDDTENQRFENQHFEDESNWSRWESRNPSTERGPSPPTRNRERGNEMPGGPGPDTPSAQGTPVPMDPRSRYDIVCDTRMELMGAIMDWAPVITPLDIGMESLHDTKWNPMLIDKGVLVFNHPWAQIRMRAWPCIFRDIKTIEDLLTLAVRFAIPFYLCIHMKDVPAFEQAEISEVERKTLPATLEPGFTDAQLQWNGGANTRASYMSLAGTLVRKPYAAAAFLALGGFANRIALWIDIEAMGRCARGPSTRVTEYHRGFMLKGVVQTEEGIGEPETLTRDQVSNDELNLLFGYINKGHPNSDVYLFPPQWLLEKECAGHFNGIITPAGQALFDYMTARIASPAIDNCWKNLGEWQSFLRSAGKGKFAAKDHPVDSDFQHGSELFKKAFGGNWNMKVLHDITVPEPFLDEIPGDSPYENEV
ncbi:hypothetical protein DFH09DRAFT_1335334 [Mycena vulgaris]|nr:hypothetical protein DFH09DRAFT_1335334 [Mycena vulgaris]